MSDHIAQKPARSHSKRTLRSIKVHLVFPQYLKNVSEVSHMLGHHLTLHHHIIYVGFNILGQLLVIIL